VDGGRRLARLAPPARDQRIGWWLQDNIALIAAIAAFFIVLGFALFILSVAAKGGSIFLVNEAEEGRPVRGMDGWAAGFRMWFRVFGIGFVLFVPYTMLVSWFSWRRSPPLWPR
jgi:hypothetical protein